MATTMALLSLMWGKKSASMRAKYPLMAKPGGRMACPPDFE